MLYRDLDPLVRCTASHLYSLGLAQGEMVGVALKNSAGHLVTVVFVKGGHTSMHKSENAMALIARAAFDYFQNPRTD